MLGAIIGDIVGSRFEYIEHKSKKFNLFDKKCIFTDDSVMTIAVAYALSMVDDFNDKQKLKQTVISCMKEIGQKYPHCGYGTFFKEWIFEDSKPHDSFGNGAAMRISPVGLFCKTENEVKKVSRIITEVSHIHQEAIKGAEATALAVYLAKQGWYKKDIKDRLAKEYYPELVNMNCDNIRKDYYYDVTCQGTVPQALTCFFESCDYEDAIRNAISLGGDSDTLAAITGGVAEAYYGIPLCIKQVAMDFLDDYLKDCIKTVINKFWF